MNGSSIRVAVSAIGCLLVAWMATHGGLFLEPAGLVLIVLTSFARLANLDLDDSRSLNLEAATSVAAILVFPLPQAIVVVFVGALLPAIVRPQTHRVLEVLTGAGATAIATAIAGRWLMGQFLLGKGIAALNLASWYVVPTIMSTSTYFMVQVLIDQLLRRWQSRGRFWPVLVGSVVRWLPTYFSLACVGVLMAIMYISMGIYGLILFSVPLIVIHYSFKLFLDIKSTYRHTIAALTRLIGLQDPHHRSHGERVADLSLEVGTNMGLFGSRLEALGYAALLHDIGKLGLDADSFDSYLDVMGVAQDGVSHANIGADILEQVEFLRPYSNMVRQHHRPYGGARRLENDHPLEARIIALVDYYDRLATGPDAEHRLTPNQVIARIKREAGEFDPKVMRALIDVVNGRRSPTLVEDVR